MWDVDRLAPKVPSRKVGSASAASCVDRTTVRFSPKAKQITNSEAISPIGTRSRGSAAATGWKQSHNPVHQLRGSFQSAAQT